MSVFPVAMSLLKGATFIDFFYFLKNFLKLFNFFFLWLCIKDSNSLLFERGLRLFKAGAMFIPDSRVVAKF